MTSTSADSAASASATAPRSTQVGSGAFMLTLCRLNGPVSIRPPQSPHLKPFSFFTSRARQHDGSERLYLHMGYFETLADAQKWLAAVRGSYPAAIATRVPPGLSQPRASAAPAPVAGESLSDTQVMRILESRGAASAASAADQGDRARIPMLRPEDTTTRHALKEAVAQGAPVSFVVQLHWSPEPIDARSVPALAVFKTHTLYTRESRRQGRACYFLRLGFFSDPLSAKEIAAQVRTKYASAAVVPVTEQERKGASEARIEPAEIPHRVRQLIDSALNSSRRLGSLRRSVPTGDGARDPARGSDTLEETLELLARREFPNDTDSVSDTGVRHLKIEVQE